MKIGICFGGYCPMHQGHMSLIMQAKKENDLCFVIVCGYDGEPRADEIGLPLKRRFTLVKKAFLNDEQITVIMQNDGELGLDESMSDNNWKIWLKAVYSKIAQHCRDIYSSDVTFYVGEPFYKKAILSNYADADIEKKPNVTCISRAINPITATLIRENPIKYWNDIVWTFRPYFSTNILITGTASEGKSTLTRDIATYFGIPFSEEYGRTYIEENAKHDTDLTVTDFIEFLIEQRRDTKHKIDSMANNGIVISDTDNLVTLMYAKAYSTDPDVDLTEDDYNNILLPLAKTIKRGITWDKIFVLPPKNHFVDDGTRYMKQATLEERNKNFEILKGLLKDFNWEDKVEILDGDYYSNFKRVKEYIEDLKK